MARELEMGRCELTEFECRVIAMRPPNRRCGVPEVDDRWILNGGFRVPRSDSSRRDHRCPRPNAPPDETNRSATQFMAKCARITSISLLAQSHGDDNPSE